MCLKLKEIIKYCMKHFLSLCAVSVSAVIFSQMIPLINVEKIQLGV